ncbi:MAG TPA: anti-sigma factor [Gemmatimonadales bacterium]|nr:anti-sigma factor [Gemmatimonadales bacterium]
MTTAPEKLQELAAAYALGALDPDEAKAFEALLATSPGAAAAVAEYREVSALLALHAGTAGPAPDLKARVRARATSRGVPRATPRPRATTLLPWLALAASLVAIVGLAVTGRGLRRELARQRAAVAALQDTLARRDATLAARGRELDAILDPDVSLIRMGEPGSPKPVVQLFWNRRNGTMMVHAFQLTPAAASRTYQLWFIPRHGKPIPSVTFNSSPSGHALVPEVAVPAGVDLTAAAITDEPEGGSPAPTTTPFLIGALGS